MPSDVHHINCARWSELGAQILRPLAIGEEYLPRCISANVLKPFLLIIWSVLSLARVLHSTPLPPALRPVSAWSGGCLLFLASALCCLPAKGEVFLLPVRVPLPLPEEGAGQHLAGGEPRVAGKLPRLQLQYLQNNRHHSSSFSLRTASGSRLDWMTV